MVEHSAVNRRVASSNLARGAILLPNSRVYLTQFVFLADFKNWSTRRESVREVKFVLQGSEAEIITQRIEFRLHPKEDQPIRTVGIGFFQPIHG